MSQYNELIRLKSRIEKCNRTETIEIFKIIHKNGEKYTQNNNGIFLDLNKICEQTQIEVRAFMDFSEENRKHINEIEAKMKENKISIDNNKYADKNANMAVSNEEYKILICSDYSPFITDLNDNTIIDSIVDELHSDFQIDKPVEISNVDDLNEIIDEDELEILEDEDEQSVSQTHTKKKKNSGIRFRILKKCKNINSCGGDGDDFEKDIFEDIDIKELSIELEVY